MRITNNILSSNLLSNLQKSSNKMIDLQNNISTGEAISKPSDDPSKITAILGLKTNITSMEQWKDNASQALDYMSSVESVTANMTSMLQRLRGLAVQGSNQTNSPEDLGEIKKEADQIIEQLGVMANSQVGSRYIFSGTNTDTAPWPGTGLWTGNTESLSVELGANVSFDISINGQQLFGVNSATGVSDFFTALNNFSTALNNGDYAAVGNSISDLDSLLSSFIDGRAELGAKISRVETINNNLETSIINAQTNLSNLRDTDLAAAIVDYNSTMNTYRAALSVGAQIIQPSLVDFLR
ncbi:MAG: flagellar hook-associated protein FlgL [Dehalobacter sp.]|nr:flagellar hook-associated protein FlgL [Dehalobacter sp.]